VRGLEVTGEEVRVTLLLRAGLAREDLDDGRIVFHEALQRGVDFIQVIEVVHAFGTAAEFAGSLRATQKQFAEDGGFETREVEGFLKAMLVFCDAAIHVVSAAGKVFFGEGAQGILNSGVVEIHGWISIGFLVTGVDERVEGKRIVIGSGDFLFDEGAEDTSFDGREMGRHWMKSYIKVRRFPSWEERHG
jgi:hypothetical protein